MLFVGSQSLGSHLSFFFIFATFGLAMNLIALKKGYFTLPKSFDNRRWLLKDTLFCLIIYLLISFLLAPLVIAFFLKIFGPLKSSPRANNIMKMMLIQCSTIGLNVLGLGLYMTFQNRMKVSCFWKDISMRNETSLIGDWVFGFLTWFLAFPIVVVVHQLCEVINKYLFKTKEIEQVAVRYLKYATEAPIPFAIALFAIVIAAPFIEEFIFRGCIQNTIRQYINSKWAIIISSIIFSAFHYSPYQGMSNFPLLMSLFFFAIYLGFLYEKRRSLYASIAFHMAFNTISVVRILLL